MASKAEVLGRAEPVLLREQPAGQMLEAMPVLPVNYAFRNRLHQVQAADAAVPHSSQGVHTYRNHAEIYRTPSRHVREINCGTKVGRRKPREGPTTGTGGFWEGYWSQSDITGPRV